MKNVKIVTKKFFLKVEKTLKQYKINFYTKTSLSAILDNVNSVISYFYFSYFFSFFWFGSMKTGFHAQRINFEFFDYWR